MRHLIRLFKRGAPALLLALVLGAGAVHAQINAYVTNTNSGSVSVIDTATNTVTATFPVGSFPRSVGVSPDGARLYVALIGGGVAIFDTLTNSFIASVPSGAQSQSMTFRGDGAFVYVTSFSNNNVTVIDTATNTVAATLTVGAFPTSSVLSPDGTILYVANAGSGTMSLIDTATNTVTDSFSTGLQPFGMAFTPDGAFLYLSDLNFGRVNVIKMATRTVVASVPTGSLPYGLSMTPDGAFVYVGHHDAPIVEVIDTATNAVVATVPVGGSPEFLSVTPDGAFVYVPSFDSNAVSVIDTATQTVVATVPVGTSPFGIAIARVINGPPALSPANTTVTFNEGQTATNTGTVTDPNRETVTLTASAGTVVNNGDGTWSWSFATSDGPTESRTVTITGNDGVGGVGSTSFALVVANVGPTITSVSNNGPVFVGGTATITVTATDPAGAHDPLGYAFDCDNNGTFEIGPQAGNSTVCGFGTAGNATVNVRVTDGDGGTALGSTVVTVLTAQEQIAAFIAEINELVTAGTLAPNKANPLITKLESVSDKLDGGQVGAACNQLGAFINQVNAYISNGTLTAADGQALIDAAKAIRVNLGCEPPPISCPCVGLGPAGNRLFTLVVSGGISIISCQAFPAGGIEVNFLAPIGTGFAYSTEEALALWFCGSTTTSTGVALTPEEGVYCASLLKQAANSQGVACE